MEVWKEIIFTPNHYEISSLGRVKSFARYPNGTILKPTLSPKGYNYVNLGRGLENRYFVHALVALVFLGDRPNGLIVNHKDGNKLNNSIENLEWTTYGQNNKHAYDKGLKIPTPNFGTKHHFHKFEIEDLKAVFELKNSNISVFEIAKKYNVHITTIYRILKKQTYSKNGV